MSVYEKFLDKNKSKLCESKSKKVSLKKLKRFNESDAKEWEEDLKETFDNFKAHLIGAYSYLGDTITFGDAINKNLRYYPQEIQDFMSEIDLNKLEEIRDNMRPILKGAAKLS